jgi:crotonobetainyl-CoA:carnitine CoA-transferase CaiB-like acyl-CoA transferase
VILNSNVSARVTARMHTAALDVHDLAQHIGATLDVDGPALLHERAQILGIAPQETVSAGGSCRLLPAADRWVAVNLARRDDIELLAAWMGRTWDGPVWDAVATALTSMTAFEAVDRAQLLGIPAAVAVTAEEAATDDQARARGQSFPPAPFVSAGVPGARVPWPPRVVDLSSLWAGPLCGRLLRAAGAPVTKVESTTRLDGARGGPPEFFRLMNEGKEEKTVDLTTGRGRAELGELLAAADVVIESSRPRAMEQLGIDVEGEVRRGVVWVSITGYGRTGPWRNRVAFGDDAAVAGGLAVAAGAVDAPRFWGDAAADPAAGLFATEAVLASLHVGGGHLVDVALREVVGHLLGPGT